MGIFRHATIVVIFMLFTVFVRCSPAPASKEYPPASSPNHNPQSDIGDAHIAPKPKRSQHANEEETQHEYSIVDDDIEERTVNVTASITESPDDTDWNRTDASQATEDSQEPDLLLDRRGELMNPMDEEVPSRPVEPHHGNGKEVEERGHKIENSGAGDEPEDVNQSQTVRTMHPTERLIPPVTAVTTTAPITTDNPTEVPLRTTDHPSSIISTDPTEEIANTKTDVKNQPRSNVPTTVINPATNSSPSVATEIPLSPEPQNRNQSEKDTKEHGKSGIDSVTRFSTTTYDAPQNSPLTTSNFSVSPKPDSKHPIDKPISSSGTTISTLSATTTIDSAVVRATSTPTSASLTTEKTATTTTAQTTQSSTESTVPATSTTAMPATAPPTMPTTTESATTTGTITRATAMPSTITRTTAEPTMSTPIIPKPTRSTSTPPPLTPLATTTVSTLMKPTKPQIIISAALTTTAAPTSTTAPSSVATSAVTTISTTTTASSPATTTANSLTTTATPVPTTTATTMTAPTSTTASTSTSFSTTASTITPLPTTTTILSTASSLPTPTTSLSTKPTKPVTAAMTSATHTLTASSTTLVTTLITTTSTTHKITTRRPEQNVTRSMTMSTSSPAPSRPTKQQKPRVTITARAKVITKATTLKPHTAHIVTYKQTTLSPTKNKYPVTAKSTKYPKYKGPTTFRPVFPEWYVLLKIRMGWREFCEQAGVFKAWVVEIMNDGITIPGEHQVTILEIEDQCTFFKPEKKSKPGTSIGRSAPRSARHALPEKEIVFVRKRNINEHPHLTYKNSQAISVRLFLTDNHGNFDKQLTQRAFHRINESGKSIDFVNKKQVEIQVVGYYKGTTESADPPPSPAGVTDSNLPIIITVSTVLTACITALSLISLIIVRRRRTRGGSQRMRASIHHESPDDDSQSLSSASITSGQRPRRGRYPMRQSMRSISSYNHAFQPDECQFSNAMTLGKLSTRSLETNYLEEELKAIPSNLPKMATLPLGAGAKNRYANVLPLQATRVPLGTTSGYINANFVRGHARRPKAYIATQAPMENTTADFWRMVWEQQSQVIVMLMNWFEDGQRKCAQYLPESDGVNSIAVFGDFEVFLKRQVIRENYILSSLVLKDMERNLCRDVVHFQYTDFPTRSCPSSTAKLLSFVKECQLYMEASHGPPVFHCTTGTGRTGTYLAIELSIRAYDESRSIDILNCVYQLRKDRAGAVQTISHYAFIYKALLEYANQSNFGGTPSQCGSQASLDELP